MLDYISPAPRLGTLPLVHTDYYNINITYHLGGAETLPLRSAILLTLHERLHHVEIDC